MVWPESNWKVCWFHVKQTIKEKLGFFSNLLIILIILIYLLIYFLFFSEFRVPSELHFLITGRVDAIHQEKELKGGLERWELLKNVLEKEMKERKLSEVQVHGVLCWFVII